MSLGTRASVAAVAPQRGLTVEAGLQRRYRTRIVVFLAGVVLRAVRPRARSPAPSTPSASSTSWRPSGTAGSGRTTCCGRWTYGKAASPRTSDRARVLRAQARRGRGPARAGCFAVGRPAARRSCSCGCALLRRGQRQVRAVRGRRRTTLISRRATLDAVLVADTYHELTARTAVLEHVFRRAPARGPRGPRRSRSGRGRPTTARRRPAIATSGRRPRRRSCNEWDSRSWIGNDRFIDTSRHRWWMIVARRTGPDHGAGAAGGLPRAGRAVEGRPPQGLHRLRRRSRQDLPHARTRRTG